MNIAVVGSRDFPKLDLVAGLVKELPPDTVVVSGGARGVDRAAADAARDAGLPVREFLPDWDSNGKAAGFMRNAEIVGAADRVVAFWDGKSRGTADTIEKAREASLPVTIIRPDGTQYTAEPAEDDSFDETDPHDGATREEYEAARERETGDDYRPARSDRDGRPKVMLLTASLRWICAAKPKTRQDRCGRTLEYFTQACFTTRGNRLILTFDPGTQPLKDGPARGRVVEIFGREIEKQANADKTQTAVIFGAEVFTRGASESPRPAAVRPIGAPPPLKQQDAAPKPFPEWNLDRLRAEYEQIARNLDYALRDGVADRDEVTARRQLAELGMLIYALERGSVPRAPDSSPELAELRALIDEQNADRFGCAGEEIDADAADENTAADILDADADGAEITRAAEPWADSSAPVGATVDADCWDCPFRLGASCIRSEGCILT